jgi:hypothetical protein
MTERVDIGYGVIRSLSGGAIPALVRGGRVAWLRRKPVDLQQARAEAKAAAEEDATHYGGDWDIRLINHGEIAHTD